MTNPPVTEEAVERVAKAICTANGEAHFEDNGFPEWRKYLPDARAAIAALKSPPVVSEVREAFLDMLADAVDWHEEPDGDETGNHTTYHLITHWRELERLCLALGIKEPGYMQTWMDALDNAIAAPSPLAMSVKSEATQEGQ